MIHIEFKDEEYIEFIHYKVFSKQVLENVNKFLQTYSKNLDKYTVDYIECIKENIKLLLIGNVEVLRENIMLANPSIAIGSPISIRQLYEKAKNKVYGKKTIKKHTSDWFNYGFRKGGKVFSLEQQNIESVHEIVTKVNVKDERLYKSFYIKNQVAIKERLNRNFDRVFFGFLMKYSNTSSPKLSLIIQELMHIKDKLLFDNIYKHADVKSLDSSLNKFFSEHAWHLHWIIEALNIDVCPYCNRQYLDDTKSSTLDHFFSKSEYPYYSLSLYNLIPSCYPCNSKAKESKAVVKDLYSSKDTKTCVSPYEYGFDEKDYHFTIKYIGEGNFVPVIQGKIPNDEIDATIDLFTLNDYYHIHSKQVNEFIKLRRVNINEYIDMLVNKTGYSRKIVYEMLFHTSFNTGDYSKRPLSKLNIDLARLLGIEVGK